MTGTSLPVECDALSKRDRQAAALAWSYAQRDGAFSVLFDFTSKRGLKVSLYREQPKPLWKGSNLAQDTDDGEKELTSVDKPAPAVAPAAAAPARPPGLGSVPPPPPRQKLGDSQTSTKGQPSGKPTQAKGPSSGGTPKAHSVDKNALSARGSPTASLMDDVDMGDGGGTQHDKPTVDPNPTKHVFPPWKSPMTRAKPGPPPSSVLSKKGKWCTAYEARLQYGDPKRQVWLRNSDGTIWEADDGDHVGAAYMASFANLRDSG